MAQSFSSKTALRAWVIVLSLAAAGAPAGWAEGRCDVPKSDSPLPAGQLTLQALVVPSTIVVHDGKPLTFALHGFIEFQRLQDLFAYVDEQAGRWQFPNEQARKEFADGLLRRGVESRVVSMLDEKPLEVLLTHT